MIQDVFAACFSAMFIALVMHAVHGLGPYIIVVVGVISLYRTGMLFIGLRKLGTAMSDPVGAILVGIAISAAIMITLGGCAPKGDKISDAGLWVDSDIGPSAWVLKQDDVTLQSNPEHSGFACKSDDAKEHVILCKASNGTTMTITARP
jgi:hypothetical protein